MRVLRTLAAAGFAVGMMTVASTAALAQPASHNWQGFYIGAVAGGAHATFDNRDYWCDLACDAPNQTSFHGTIGVTAGHNWQSGNAVFGIEADLSTGFDDNRTVYWSDPPDPDGSTWTNEWNWIATIRGRAGLTVGDMMVFATGGLAIVDVDFRSEEFDGSDRACDDEFDDDNLYCAHYSDTEYGVALGAGAEYAVSPDVTVKFEYLFVGLPTVRDRYDDYEDNEGTDGYYSVTSSAHMGRIGVNWALN